MNAYYLDIINLLLRWLHVVAAIAWIGESIYFVMLDNSLRPPPKGQPRAPGVFGEMWAVHGGGFYHNQKYLVQPETLPEDLHWSFWKAYTTWLSGFALFAALYLIRADIYLVNPDASWAWVAALSGWQAGLLASALLIAGWVTYDQLCRRISPDMQRDGLLSIAVALMMVGVAWLSGQLFQGRAAFLLTGAVMATAMSANVFFWIIPGQRRMVNAMRTGQPVNALDGKRGKQRSVHNTYFTLPVVLLMLSNHYSFIYSGSLNWVIMSVLMLAGALIRQYFVLRHSGVNRSAYPLAGILLLVAAFWMAAPQPHAIPAASGEGGTGASARVQAIVSRRCVQCHSTRPTMAGFVAAPAGILLDSPDEVRRHAARIRQTVGNGYMPLGNLTQMTPDERAVIGSWRP